MVSPKQPVPEHPTVGTFVLKHRGAVDSKQRETTGVIIWHQPQTMQYSSTEIPPKKGHKFALFDSPQMGNLMPPEQTYWKNMVSLGGARCFQTICLDTSPNFGGEKLKEYPNRSEFLFAEGHITPKAIYMPRYILQIAWLYVTYHLLTTTKQSPLIWAICVFFQNSRMERVSSSISMDHSGSGTRS